MLYLKITHGKEIHLLTKEANYNELLKFIKDSFKNLPKGFEITYKDSDGDNISISNDEDMKTLYATSKEKFVKISIAEVEEGHHAVETVSEKNEEPKAEEVKVVEAEAKPTEEKVEAPVVEVMEPVVEKVEEVKPVEIVPEVKPVEVVEEKKEEPEKVE